jgi:hypothetical protein
MPKAYFERRHARHVALQEEKFRGSRRYDLYATFDLDTHGFDLSVELSEEYYRSPKRHHGNDLRVLGYHDFCRARTEG